MVAGLFDGSAWLSGSRFKSIMVDYFFTTELTNGPEIEIKPSRGGREMTIVIRLQRVSLADSQSAAFNELPGDSDALFAEIVSGEVPDSDVLVWLPQPEDPEERRRRSRKVESLLSKWTESEDPATVAELDDYAEATAWMVTL
jgi:hypothetical protein